MKPVDWRNFVLLNKYKKWKTTIKIYSSKQILIAVVA